MATLRRDTHRYHPCLSLHKPLGVPRSALCELNSGRFMWVEPTLGSHFNIGKKERPDHEDQSERRKSIRGGASIEEVKAKVLLKKHPSLLYSFGLSLVLKTTVALKYIRMLYKLISCQILHCMHNLFTCF